MKKLLLSLVLLASTTHVFPNERNTTPTPLTPEERRFLGTIYWNKKNAASFAQGLTLVELQYSIDLLLRNIHILEHTLLPGNDWPGKKALMIAGGLATTFYGGIASFVTYEVYKRNYEFITGKFDYAIMPKAKVDDLTSIRFSLKEKRYLKQFKAENIIIGDWWHWVSEWDKKRTQEITAKLSRRDKEKVTYYALKETVNYHKNRFLRDAFQPALFIAATVAILGTTLYGIIYHTEILQGQLEDCKNLYQAFKKEQEHRLSLAKNKV